MLELVPPTAALREAWTDAHEEWGPGPHEDGFGLAPDDDVRSEDGFAAWVARRTAAEEHGTGTCRWIVEDGRVLGGIALRHEPGPHGHIGYGVRPSARGRGVATWALAGMLSVAQRLGLDRVLVVCEPGNTASARTIERGGGRRVPGDGASWRYWIDLRPLVRPALAEDLAALERAMPTGLNRLHDERYARQAAGGSTLLLAFTAGEPVGHAEIMWAGPREPSVRVRFPGCPEINGLGVGPAHQSRGVGTAVIRAAEGLATLRGVRRIGLGVDDGNTRAAALYLRLGYAETGCRYEDRYWYTTESGRHEAADPCRFLVKDLG